MIEKATLEDIEEIMKIVNPIKKDFQNEGNKQWGSTQDDYPSIKQFSNDIAKNGLYLYKEDGIIKGFISITLDDENYYDGLLETSTKKSYLLHRLAVSKEYRNQNIAYKLMKIAEDLARKNNINVLKGDTEEKNTKMQKLFIKLGYRKIGEFEYDDYPGHYVYFEKEIGSDVNV